MADKSREANEEDGAIGKILETERSFLTNEAPSTDLSRLINQLPNLKSRWENGETTSQNENKVEEEEILSDDAYLYRKPRSGMAETIRVRPTMQHSFIVADIKMT